MSFVPQEWMLSWPKLLLLLLLVSGTSHPLAASKKTKNNIKKAVFLSPKIELKPGSVSNKNYFNLDFPRGHIALKSFNAEVVDEAGNSVPLQETYLHHWIVIRYHQPKNMTDNKSLSGIVSARNSGFCQGNVLGQYYGFGSETRGTTTYIPDPFAIEVGNPKKIPKGYKEKWLLNVHAIDTRGVEDRMGCIECRCNLYNVTKVGDGKQLNEHYKGGLQCCPHDSKCRLRKGFQGPKRSFYLKYTVMWINWDKFVVPVKVYVLDVTDTVKISNKAKVLNQHDCKIEYEVEPCYKDHVNGSACVDVKRASFPMKNGGYLIYGVAHQHAGATGSTLYRQDGRVICTSIPKYGNGRKPGNEKGYVVGMSTCYPKPGSVKILDGETLILETIYNNNKIHSGAMGIFYILVAKQFPHNHV